MDNHEDNLRSLIEEASLSRNSSHLHQGKTDTLIDLPTCLSKRSDLPPIQKHERRFSSHSEKKSVTFSFSGSERSNHILNASDCFAYMRKGSEMIKLHTSGRQYKRMFYLNEQMNCIKWSSTNKRQSNSQIDIEEIHEVQLGCSSRTTHSLGRRRPLSMTPTLSHGFLSSSGSGSLIQSASKMYSSNNSSSLTIGSMSPQIQSSTSLNSTILNLSSSAFTICYGPDFTVLEILASGPEEANIWVTGLKCLMAGAQDPQVLEDRQKPRDRWLQILFHEADSTNQGYLSEFEVIRLIRSINPSLSSIHLRHKLKEMESKVRCHKTGITKDDFVNFFKKVATRQEIYYILVRYSSGSEHLSAEDLKNFFESEQGRTGLTRDQCKALINRYEPSHENRQYNLMGIDGFTLLLLSEECDIFNPVHLQVCQDMSQPITHYYIASSHKTFLLEDQLTGPCSIEGYQRALLSGCRYIELEVYDGHDGHPVVRRANSRPPGIPIQAVLNTIHDFAFIRSEYPVIVSIECYATQAQQRVLVTFLRCCLGNRLLLPNSEFTFNLSESQLEIEEQVEKTKLHSMLNNKANRKNSLTVVDLKNESTVYTSNGFFVRWPSPRDLIGRILLQGKRLPKGSTTIMNTSNNESEKWMNGGLPNLRRVFNSFYTSHQETPVIGELSDMFFFDTTNYEQVADNDSIKSNISSLNMNRKMSSLSTITSSSSTRGIKSDLKLDHSYNNTHNSSTSPVVIVGGTQTETNHPTMIMKNFQYQSKAKLDLYNNSNLKDKRNTTINSITNRTINNSMNNTTHNNNTTNKHYHQDHIHLHPYYIIIMSESEASRAIGTGAGDLVQLTRNSLIQICPSPSRADSSNLNPLDIWAWGGQIVTLNYQTAGLIMDLATGFFARNGACGYVLKPNLYRQYSSFFTPYKSNLLNITERPPDTTPQVLRLKIVSAQQLPKPRGSVSKGDTIEPYVVVEIHGIPVDCAEQRTVTAPAGSASGYNAIFEDTFEFCVQLGSLALVRFVVLDDHAIGDDFIGQNTVPFDCLLTGFRHVRLRSDTGEPIPLATLFVHITITTRTDNSHGETNTGLLHRWRSRNRQQLQLKKVGVSTFDEIFKATATTLRQVCELRTSVLSSFDNFRRLCGETSTPLSMNQCIRALSTRIATSFGSPDMWPVRMRIRPEDEMPHLEIQNSFSGSGLSGYPSLSTLGDPISHHGTLGSSLTRNSSLRFSPSPGLHRSPSLILSPRLFLNRRLKSSSKSIDEDSASALSIDVMGCHGNGNSSTHSVQEHSPTVSTNNIARRPSIHSSSSSISSFSVGRLDKLKKAVSEFENLIESCKTLIKQGPYLRVKLQQTQRTALDAYTTFLEGLKAPSSHATAISKLTSSATAATTSLRSSISHGNETRFGSLTSEISRRVTSHISEDNSDNRNKTTTTGTSIYWRRMSRVADNVTWNLRLLTGQTELMTLLLNESNEWIKQAKESSQATGLLIKLDTSSITDSHSSPTSSDKDQLTNELSIEVPLTTNKPLISDHIIQDHQTSSNRSLNITSNEISNNLNSTNQIDHNITSKSPLSPLLEIPRPNQVLNTLEPSNLSTFETHTTPNRSLIRSNVKNLSSYKVSTDIKQNVISNETTITTTTIAITTNIDTTHFSNMNSSINTTTTTTKPLPASNIMNSSGNLSKIRNRFNQAWKK
uniref:Phosphoinositide phospholipase C n=1 Tax=Schistosoma mansoni TaxID=6183 RepID=A0A3Q0KTJ3_SCHMA